MNERDMQFELYRYRQYRDTLPMMLCNIYFFRWWESDVLYVTRSRYVWEYEIKLSHSDFLHDSKKAKKHLSMSNGNGPARFYYFCPRDVISVDEVPDHAGLLWLIPEEQWVWKRVAVMKEAPQRKTNKLSPDDLQSLMSKSINRYWTLRDKEYRRVPCSTSR